MAKKPEEAAEVAAIEIVLAPGEQAQLAGALADAAGYAEMVRAAYHAAQARVLASLVTSAQADYTRARVAIERATRSREELGGVFRALVGR